MVDKSYRIIEGNVPVIVHIPHNSTHFPYHHAENAHLEHLHDSLYTLADLHTDFLYTKLQERFVFDTFYVFESLVSRLYMDPERFDDDREVMNSQGMGVVYTKNHNLEPLYRHPLTPDEIDLRKHYYREYHTAFEQLVEDILTSYGRCVILDLHSYASQALPYELYPDADRTPLILGTDAFHSTLFRDLVPHDYSYIGENTAFQGTFVPMRYYYRDDRVQSIMFEVRKDVYMNESTFTVEPNPQLFDTIVSWMETFARRAISPEDAI